MSASWKTMKEVKKIVMNYVDSEKAKEMASELQNVSGNGSFEESIRRLGHLIDKEN